MKLTGLLYGGLKAKSDEEFYFLGLNSFLEGKLLEAKDFFTESAKLNTDNAEAFFQLARVNEQLGSHEKALKLLMDLSFRPQLEPEFKDRILRKSLELYLMESKGAEALNLFKEHWPKTKDLELLNHKLQAFILLEQWSDAVKLGNQLFKSNLLSSAELAELETQAVLEQNEGKVALKELYKILRTEPKCSKAWVHAIEINRELKDFNNLCSDWKNWFRHCPKEALKETHSMEEDFFEANKYHEVLGIFQESFHQFSAPPAQLVHALVRGYAKIGNEMAIHEIFEKLIPLAQHSPEQHLQTLLQVYVEYEEANSSTKAIRKALLDLFKQNLKITVKVPEDNL